MLLLSMYLEKTWGKRRRDHTITNVTAPPEWLVRESCLASLDWTHTWPTQDAYLAEASLTGGFPAAPHVHPPARMGSAPITSAVFIACMSGDVDEVRKCFPAEAPSWCKLGLLTDGIIHAMHTTVNA